MRWYYMNFQCCCNLQFCSLRFSSALPSRYGNCDRSVATGRRMRSWRRSRRATRDCPSFRACSKPTRLDLSASPRPDRPRHPALRWGDHGPSPPGMRACRTLAARSALLQPCTHSSEFHRIRNECTTCVELSIEIHRVSAGPEDLAARGADSVFPLGVPSWRIDYALRTLAIAGSFRFQGYLVALPAENFSAAGYNEASQQVRAGYDQQRYGRDHGKCALVPGKM